MDVRSATVLTQTAWTSLCLNRRPDAQDPDGYAVDLLVHYATHQYLGDQDGKPLQILNANMFQGNRFMPEEQMKELENLGEIVTREDGTKATLFEILDEKISRAIIPCLPKET